MKGKSRGGRNQREARSVASASASLGVVDQSDLARWLTLQVLHGHASPQFAQTIVKKTRVDMKHAVAHNLTEGFSDFNVLAGLGTEGKHAQNMWNELVRKLEKQYLNSFEASIPLKLLEKNAKPHDQHILLPHETFATLFHMYPAAWKERVVPSQEALSKFWKEVSDHPLLIGHPVRERRNWWELAVPYSIHGDGVPCVGVGKSWGKTMELFSWCSCLASGNTMATFFLRCVRDNIEHTFRCEFNVQFLDYLNVELGSCVPWTMAFQRCIRENL